MQTPSANLDDHLNNGNAEQNFRDTDSRSSPGMHVDSYQSRDNVDCHAEDPANVADPHEHNEEPTKSQSEGVARLLCCAESCLYCLFQPRSCSFPQAVPSMLGRYRCSTSNVDITSVTVLVQGS